MPLPVRDFIKQRLLEFDPTFDTGDGVATTTLLIDPLSLILQPVRDEVDQVKANQSIKTIEESADPDLFPEDVVDGLASNFVVTRKDGAQSQVTVRIRFFEPQDFSAAIGTVTALGSSGQRFVNKDAVGITAAQMALNKEGTLFFVDVICVANDVGELFNVAAGDIQSLENAPDGVVSVTNLLDSDNLGRNRETNTELLERVKVAITVRALVTGRGIISLLTDNFLFLKEVQPIGFGDPEMMRDVRFNTHIGGNSDVYVKTPVPNIDQQDFDGLIVDFSRRLRYRTSIVAKVTGGPVSVRNFPIDITDRPFKAAAFDPPGIPVFTAGVAYTIDLTTGTFVRLDNGEPGVYPNPSTPGHIYHNVVAVAKGKITAPDKIRDDNGGGGGNLTFARKGMILTIPDGFPGAGVYQVKSASAFEITIFGTFRGVTSFPTLLVPFQVDEHISLDFDYNPVAIDVIKPARSTPREPFTITKVPELLIDSIEQLDPITGEPTGVLLEEQGGFGSGGFGVGGFGVGEPGDWIYIVNIPNLRFSAKEDNVIRFRGALIGVSVRVNFRHADEIQDVQAYMDDSLNRSETASLIAKHFIPIFIKASKPIVFRVRAGTVTADDTAILQALNDFVEGIRADNDLQKSDFVQIIYDQCGGDPTKVQVDLDFKLSGDIQHEDGTVEFVLEDAQGVLTPPTPVTPAPPLDFTERPFSPRIAHFSVRELEITRITT